MKPKKSESKFTQESLLEAAAARVRNELLRTRELQNEPIPPGWFTAAELAPAMKTDETGVRRAMRMINAPSKKFRKWITNHYRSITYYKPYLKNL